MKRKLLYILLVLALASCSKTDKPSFCFENDPTKSYCLKNGDLFSLSNTNVETYSDFQRNSTAQDIKKTIDWGNQSFVLLYSSTCQACKKYLPFVAELERDSFLEIHFVEVSNYVPNQVESLISLYPNGNYSTVFSGITIPSLYLLESPISAKKLDITTLQSGTALENLIQPIVNVTNIYTYNTYDGFMKSLSSYSGFCYILNSSGTESVTFFDQYVNKKAKYSNKPTSIINWTKLSETDKNSFITTFNLQSDFEVAFTYNAQGNVLQKHSYISEIDQLNNVINSYY